MQIIIKSNTKLQEKIYIQGHEEYLWQEMILENIN